MKYLIDTDWTINVLKNKKGIGDLVRELAKEGMGISSASVAEVLTGIVKEDHEVVDRVIFNKFLSLVEEIPFDQKLTERFALIRKDLLRKHTPLENFDIVIAATALEYNLVLLTNNTEHFKRVKGLKIYIPNLMRAGKPCKPISR